MLRWIVLLVAVLPLAACESGQEFWGPVADNGWLFGDAPAPTAPPPNYDNEHCKKVAYARASDAKVNGFDGDMRDEIYSGTYADCAAWDRAHPAPQAN
jgi:hypothetical protein